jgi:hypothetical protein
MYSLDRAKSEEEQCKFVIPGQGRCLNKSVAKDCNCVVHGGVKQANALEKQRIRNYQFVKFQERLDAFTDSSNLKSLREEVAMLRFLLETQVNMCNSASELICSSNIISDLVTKIEKVVKSCHSLEVALGQMMSVAQVNQFATEIISIISEEIQDEEVLKRISERLSTCLEKCSSPKSLEDSDENQ